MGIQQLFQTIVNHYHQPALGTATIVSVILMVFLMSAYEFLIYSTVSQRAFYNKSFNISLAVMPFFIAAIILALQSNLVITLGTIGALAILRYRTSVKDPIDMMYLLWSVFIGIACGCQLYEVGVLTNVGATIALLIMNRVSFGKGPVLIMIHDYNKADKTIIQVLSGLTRQYRIKSRTRTSRGTDYVIEISGVSSDRITETLTMNEISFFSVVEYDSQDIV